MILFDIGGGSSEIVWLDLRNRCGARGYALTRFIRSWISLPVGVVNLAERHGGVHVTPEIFEAMVEDAAAHLDGFSLADNLSEAIASGGIHMLGTSGTVTTLAGVHLGLKRYDRRRVDGTWLRDDQVSGMIDQLRICRMRPGWKIPVSVPIEPILFWPVALFWKRSGGAGPAPGCASPTGGCARAF